MHGKNQTARYPNYRRGRSLHDAARGAHAYFNRPLILNYRMEEHADKCFLTYSYCSGYLLHAKLVLSCGQNR